MDTTTATTNAAETGIILKKSPRDEQIAALTPERRALYERISNRREKAGRVEHDVVASLRELRDNG